MIIRSKTYTNGFWEIIKRREENEIAHLLGALYALDDLFQSEPMVKHIMHSPKIPLGTKEKLILALSKTLDMDKETSRFLVILLQRRVFHLLPKIVKHLKEKYEDTFGIVDVLVETAQKLTPEKKEKGEELIKRVFSKNKVQWTEKIQPDIKGGMIMSLQGYTIDASMGRKMKRLKETLHS